MNEENPTPAPIDPNAGSPVEPIAVPPLPAAPQVYATPDVVEPVYTPEPVVTPLAGPSQPDLDYTAASAVISAPVADYTLPPITPTSDVAAEKPGKTGKRKGGLGIQMLFILAIVQFIVIIGLTAVLLNVLTNGSTKVVLDGTDTQAENPTDDETDGENEGEEEPEVPPTAQNATYFAFYDKGLMGEKDLPEGSIPFLNEETGTYFVPVSFVLDATSSQSPLQQALNKLLAIKTQDDPNSDFLTTLHLSDIRAEISGDATAGFTINLVGNLVAEGDLSPAYMKAQLENTVKNYTDKFTFQLNGSVEEYKNYGSQRG